MNSKTGEAPVPFYGWRMVLLACACVNVGVGFTFGAYGTFMSSIVAEFSAPRSLAAGGLSIMSASMGLLAPVAGYALRRWSIRATLATGFIFMSTGWALMSFASNAWQFICAFGLLCGAAAACLIVVPPMTLINNWFIAHRGRAIGITMVAIMMAVAPSVIAAGITAFGWRATALAISIVVLLLSPLTLWVIDRPESIGQEPLGGRRTNADDKIPAETQQKDLLREPVFWLLIICGGLYGAAGSTMGVHLVPFAIGRGMSLESAALLASVFGAAALAGGLFSGMVADRIGGARTFVIIALLQFVAWPCLLLPNGYMFLAACVAVIGLCGNAILPVVTTLVVNMFGRTRFARAMGLFTMLTMPFGFALPLLAGAAYDVSGSYRQVFLLCAAFFAVAAAIFCFVYRIEANRRATTDVPAIAVVLD